MDSSIDNAAPGPEHMSEEINQGAALLRIASDLEQLRLEAERIGQPLLASLLELSKTEAEDAFNTAAEHAQFTAELNLSGATAPERELDAEIAAKVSELEESLKSRR